MNKVRVINLVSFLVLAVLLPSAKKAQEMKKLTFQGVLPEHKIALKDITLPPFFSPAFVRVFHMFEPVWTCNSLA
jgi:hypothetical protein